MKNIAIDKRNNKKSLAEVMLPKEDLQMLGRRPAEPTKEQWGKWLNHKSNKERYMESQGV